MARRSDASLAALLLVQRLVDVGADPLKASEYWAILDLVSDPAALLGQSAEDLARSLGVEPALAARMARLLDGGTAVAFALEELEQSGVSALTHLDQGYPGHLAARLGRQAPAVLYAAGPPELLSLPAIGIVGAPVVEADGAAVAGSLARTVVEHDHAVASGGGSGVEEVAIRAGLEAGGRVVSVLAESLIRRLRGSATRTAVLEGRACICTPFPPTARRSAATAVGGARVLFGLCEAAVVIPSDGDGDDATWAGAREAIRTRPTDVAVWTGPGVASGRAELLDRGARALDRAEHLFPLQAPSAAAPPDQAYPPGLGI